MARTKSKKYRDSAQKFLYETAKNLYTGSVDFEERLNEEKDRMKMEIFSSYMTSKNLSSDIIEKFEEFLEKEVLIKFISLESKKNNKKEF